jgi:23S rRNA (cytidine1920-2'-O)/16S rRNA (cytidine1409-2'-O)-methyltransferase
MRLDNYLVKYNFIDSRTKAQELIKNSLVLVNSKVIKKPSFKVENSSKIELKDFKYYVSRSAKKLAYFLKEIDLDIKNKVALDIGSSTGGFTQVLLENGVLEVSAVDVGHNQLHKSLKDNNRVLSYEGCDIREFQTDKKFDIVVSDVSFISLHNILSDVDRLATKDIILLFKPQFEVGREAKRDKNGVVVDKKAIFNAMIKFEDATKLKNWKIIKKSPSKVTGKDGNLEYCYYFIK